MTRATLVIIALIAAIGGYLAISRFSDSKSKIADPSDVSQWTEYHDVDQHFKIRFPTPPEHASHSIKDKEDNLRVYNIYASKALDGTVYLITEISFPPDVKPAEKEGMLQAIVQEMVDSKPVNQLVSSNKVQFLGQPAIDFVINNGDDTQVDGLTFAKNNILYSLTRIANKDASDEEKFKQYTDSFSLSEGTPAAQQ